MARTQVTRELCAFLAAVRYDQLPEKTVHAARRGVLDWLGCAAAGSAHPTVSKLIDALRDAGGGGKATVVGRNLQLGMADAAMANGVMVHVLDYDDTYMTDTVLHAAAPALGALFALAEHGSVDGERFLLAYVAGFEAAVRVARATPLHHKRGWHATGTLGAIAAGVAGAKLLGLDARGLTHTLGIAATQAAGILENRDSMCKSLHAGKAGANGLLAALLAKQGFDSSHQILEAKLGFCEIYGARAAPEALIDSLGKNWAIEGNGHKPYPCAIGLHPSIDALLAIRARHAPDPRLIERIELRVNAYIARYRPLGAPTSGSHSKFSVYHSAAVALIDGVAGVAQFTEARAGDPAVLALGNKIQVVVDDSLHTDQAQACVVVGAERYEATVDHATGTADNPMSDAAIEAKFVANAEPVIGRDRVCRASAMVWNLEQARDVGGLISLLA